MGLGHEDLTAWRHQGLCLDTFRPVSGALGDRVDGLTWPLLDLSSPQTPAVQRARGHWSHEVPCVRYHERIPLTREGKAALLYTQACQALHQALSPRDLI